MKQHFYIVALLLWCACGNPAPKTETASKPVFDVKTIIGKTPEQVETILGKAETTEKVKPSKTPCPCDKKTYKKGEVEIVFMDGKADWITLRISDLPYDKKSIHRIGLNDNEPTFNNMNVTRWTDLNGLKEISMFNNGSQQVDYFYIKAYHQ